VLTQCRLKLLTGRLTAMNRATTTVPSVVIV
jgi:hypothetical protein